ncbi:MAG: deoxyribodipyrimidine photo-lyase, partial [Pseudomonadota bacterium]
MSENPIICWFRQDLRLADNPALTHAAESGKPVVALYILDELSPGIRPMGAAQKWWLHHALADLANNLNQAGTPLILRSGAAADVVAKVMEETSADAIVWNRRYGEAEQSVDRDIKSAYDDARSFDGLLMHEPARVRTGSDKPYKVYTPF